MTQWTQHLVTPHRIRRTDSDTDNSDSYDNYGDRLEKMRLLVESSDVKVGANMSNNDGDMVLHCAVKINHVTLVEYLMTLDEIDVHLRNKACSTVLDFAKEERCDTRMLMPLESRLADRASAKRIGRATVPIRWRRPRQSENGDDS